MTIAHRYRALSSRERVMWVVGPLLILAAVVAIIWYGLATTMGKAWSSNMAFDVRDSDRVVVRYQVIRPTDRTTSCTVIAQDMQHATVGSAEDVIPPGPEREVIREVEVRTTSQAVMGEVRGCRVQ